MGTREPGPAWGHAGGPDPMPLGSLPRWDPHAPAMLTARTAGSPFPGCRPGWGVPGSLRGVPPSPWSVSERPQPPGMTPCPPGRPRPAPPPPGRRPRGRPCPAPPAEHRVQGPSVSWRVPGLRSFPWPSDAPQWVDRAASVHSPAAARTALAPLWGSRLPGARRVVRTPQPWEALPLRPPAAAPSSAPASRASVSGSSASSPALVCPGRARPRAWEALPHRGCGLHLAGAPWPWRVCPGGARCCHRHLAGAECGGQGSGEASAGRAAEAAPARAPCRLLGARVLRARVGPPSASHMARRAQW